MSLAEYEAFEEAQTETKFEWADGEAIEMAGGTRRHSQVKVTLAALLWYGMRGRPGDVYDSDLRVRTGAGPRRYPDTSVVVGESRFARHPRDEELDLLNPTAIFEVLSDSTADTDEGAKLDEYAATPSVTDYVIADGREMRIVHRSRTGPAAEWVVTTLTDPADVLELPACGFAATLAEIYEGVALG